MVSDKTSRFARLRLPASLWKPIWTVLFPSVLFPLLVFNNTQEAKCAYVIIVMAVFWMTEPVPLPVTALIPIVLFPLLGVANTKLVSQAYANKTLMMFLGGLLLAIAVEQCNLHKRIALRVLMCIGTGVRWLMLGFMLTTMFLSMWISNTAATAMMVPIVEAVLGELAREQEFREEISIDNINANAPSESLTIESQEKIPCDVTNASKDAVESHVSNEDNNTKISQSTLRVALLLSVAYAANCGGTGTLTGTGPNLVLKGLYESYFPHAKDVTYGSWMAYNVPSMLLCVLIAWVFLQFFFFCVCCRSIEDSKKQNAIKQIIVCKYKELGLISFHEAAVLILFITLILLWLLRDPEFMPGWASLFNSDVKIDDATPAIAISILLFIIPAKPRQFRSSPPLLDWKTAQDKMPWGILLLLGGGFALAKSAEESGLSVWIGNQLTYLDSLSPVAIVFLLCVMTAALTEIASNTATATVLLPVIKQLSLALDVHPLYMMLPVTVTCSFAFMLPVATPPNAIAFESAGMKTIDMVKPGVVMNIICVCVQVLLINTFGMVVFDFSVLPAKSNSTFETTNKTALSSLSSSLQAIFNFTNMS
ncbi:Na(+)/citrate cotransporter-like isoform X2 [Tachypleus tridentatus]|uniref:Na(+)/citrate cotransporter-like isoform X2 n=1 Tax=Tachypleus tridentatus TaxID=6853 RepID=UPI003FD43C2A